MVIQKSRDNVHVLLFVLLCLFSLLWLVQDVIAQPNSINPGQTITDSLDADHLLQTYSFDGASGDIVGFEASSTDDLALALIVTGPFGEVLQQSTESNGEGLVELKDVRLLESGTHFVHVLMPPGQSTADGGEFELFRLANIIIDVGDAATPVTTTTDVEPTVEPELVETAEATPIATEEATTAAPEATVVSTAITDADASQVLLTSGMEVALSWDVPVDLNLEIRDPVGETLYYDSRSSSAGGNFGFDANGLCEIISDAPLETATWDPGFLPTGSYEILIFYRQSCDETVTNAPFSLAVTVNGTPLGTIQDQLAPPTQSQESVYITSFEVNADQTAQLNQGGVYSGISVLPTAPGEIIQNAQPIAVNTLVPGQITNDQPYVAYTLEGDVGDLWDISLGATSGSLDTLLQVLDSSGTIISVNDDSNNTRNSEILALPLVNAGTYYIVATRYGKEIGGTEGDFTLIVRDSLNETPVSSTTTTGEIVSTPTGTTVFSTTGLPEADIRVNLQWNSNADLQLLVRDPVGDAVFDDQQRVNSGGILDLAGNVGCLETTSTPVSDVYWPVGLGRPGTYEVEVWFQSDCDDATTVAFVLTAVVNGETIISERQLPLRGQRYVTSFTVAPDGTAVANPGGIVGGSETLGIDFATETANAPVITAGETVSGTISTDNPYDLYVFDGTAGDVVTIEMSAIAPPLDTSLFLMDPNFAEIAANDDVTPGEDKDSLISQVTLPQDGRYTIIATRYAGVYGGTVGNYQLTLRSS